MGVSMLSQSVHSSSSRLAEFSDAQFKSVEYFTGAKALKHSRPALPLPDCTEHPLQARRQLSAGREGRWFGQERRSTGEGLIPLPRIGWEATPGWAFCGGFKSQVK